jgi:transcriptional regulator with XRE-family HTH domain
VRARQVIVHARVRAGLTQAEVGCRIGTSQSAIARLERGENEPSWERVQNIVDACGMVLTVSVDDPDPVETAAIRRNLALSVDERFTKTVNAGRFVIAGREALASRTSAEQS